jgi:hypothetical protein
VVEFRALTHQPIDIRRLDQLLAIAGEIRRHVVDDEPEHVRARFRGDYGLSHACQRENDKGQVTFHAKRGSLGWLPLIGKIPRSTSPAGFALAT